MRVSSGRGGSESGEQRAEPPHSEPAEARAYVRYFDAVSAFEQTRGYKRRALELLEAGPGPRVLDVGCGAGDEVQALARLVGSDGLALGLDVRPGTAAEAHRRTARGGSPAAFVAGDAVRLPFPDAAFDRCRTDRVLQRLAAPPGADAPAGDGYRPALATAFRRHNDPAVNGYRLVIGQRCPTAVPVTIRRVRRVPLRTPAGPR